MTMNRHTYLVERPAGYGGEHDERLFKEVEPEKQTCSCCGQGAYPIHRPLAFKAGQLANVWLCDLCFEEFEAGSNPLYKPTKAESI